MAVREAFDQAVQADFAQVVTNLVEGVVLFLEVALFQDGLMQLGGGPAFEMAAGPLEENLQQAQDSFLFQLEARNLGFTLDDRLGQAGQHVELPMDVEVLRLDGGEAVGDLPETLAHGVPVNEGFLEAKVPDIIADQFQTEEGGGFLILFEKGVSAVGPEDLLAVIDPFHHVLELAADSPGIVFAKESDDPISRQQVKPQFAGALENGANRPGTLEDEIAAVFNLFHDVEPVQPTAGGALFGGKLRRHNERPVIDALLQGLGVEPVGGRLELGGIGHRDETVVVFNELDPLACELSLDKIMAVEIGRNGEGKKGADPQDHRSGDRVHDVKIEMGVEAALFAHNLVVGVGAGELGLENAKGPTLLPALDNVINPELARLQAAVLAGSDQVLMAHLWRRPLQRHLMIAGKLLHPGFIILAPLAEQFLGDLGMATNIAEEINYLRLAHQAQEMTINDDSIKAMIKPLQIRLKKLKKELHRRYPLGRVTQG